MSQTVHSPAYDTKPRRPSTLHMPNKAYKVRKALQVTVRRTDDVKEHYIVEHSGKEIKTVTSFLEVFSAAMKTQSSHTYVTLRFMARLL